MLLLINLFLDNERNNHTKLIWEWPARTGRIKLHFIPSYCPHPNPIKLL